jgi:Fe-S cluster assembly iron-binding protein IscA
MANDPSNRPKPPVLKRFANLDIDGVDKPPREPARPAPKATPPVVTRQAAQSQDDDQDIRDFQALAAELNDNVKNTQPTPGTGPRPRFTMPMPDNPQNRARAQRAAEIAAQRPPDPAYFTLRERAERTPPTPAPTMTRSTVTLPLRPQTTTTTRTMRAPPAVAPNTPLWDLPRETPTGPTGYDFDVDDFAGTPGVMTVEMDLRRSARQPRPGQALAPIELTPMAARQIMLMSWEAGVPGSALRILTSSSPGLGRPELDFAFDEHIEADDLVYETQGVTIVIDPGSLRWVSGRRITWHDVPGSEGFRLG